MRLKVGILNTLHFPVEVEGYEFLPGKEVEIEVESTSFAFRNIRSVKGLRVGKADNAAWIKKYMPDAGKPKYKFNMVYDTYSQHRGAAYVKAIEALAMPMIEHLPQGSSGFVDRPGVGLNVRFFSSMRIRQQGKAPVGPYDVFYSHGIGDKNYWIAEHIADYQFAMVPGLAWKRRIEDGGYKGKVFVVGYTKLDPLFNGEYKRVPREKPYVVWAPTHGYVSGHRGRSSYPQCLTLIREIPKRYETALALHPTSRMGLHNKQNVTMQELLDADVVIADAGSTLYEAWALGKPVIFPDWICKRDILDHFQPGNLEWEIYHKGIGYHADSMSDLVRLIDVALEKGMRQREIDFIEQVFPSELRGNSGREAAQVLTQIYDDHVKTSLRLG